MTNFKDIKVLYHLMIFKTALSSLCFRNKPSAIETNFSQALFTRIKGKLCTREAYFNLRAKKNQGSDIIRQEARPVLRLRGGANGDEEKWLCNVCGKTLVSKRNLDEHMNSVHVNHPDFTCITSADGLLKWKCCVCNNLLSSKQRIISHLEKSHGKTNLQQANKQTYNSRTTLWRNRKRSADGYFVSEQVCSSPCSSLNISESCPVSDKEPLLVPEGASSTPCFFQSILRETEEQNSGVNTSWQNKPHESSTEDGYLENNQNDSFDNLHSNLIINPISSTDDSYTSDSECSSADDTATDYSCSETEPSSSDESDCEELKDKSDGQVSNGPFKDFSEEEKLSIVILSYIA